VLESLKRLILRDSSPKPPDDPVGEVHVIQRAITDTQQQIATLQAERLHRLEIIGTVGAETAIGKGDAWLDDIGDAQDSRLEDIDAELTRAEATMPHLQQRLEAAQQQAKRHELQQRQQQVEALKAQHREALASYRAKQGMANEALTYLRQVEESIRTLGQQIFLMERDLGLILGGARFASPDIFPESLESMRRAWEKGKEGLPAEHCSKVPVIEAEVVPIERDPLPVGEANHFEAEGHRWSIQPATGDATCAMPKGGSHCTEPAVWEATYNAPTFSTPRTWRYCESHGHQWRVQYIERPQMSIRGG
jgi:hypothetical protein